jgi:hypothetical protein
MRAGNTPRHSPAAAIAGGPTRLLWCGVAGVVAMRVLLSMFVVLLLGAASAHAQVYHGNDTGGIIPWSRETEAAAPQIAARYCARWD